MLPQNTLNVNWEQVGPGTHNFFTSGLHTLLGMHIQQSGQASDTLLQCNGTTFFRNYGKDTAYFETVFPCTGTIALVKTGNDSAYIGINYVNGDYSTMSNLLTEQVEIATSSASAIHDALTVDWFFQIMMLLVVGIWLGLYIFKK
jgi:hypothetical protein